MEFSVPSQAPEWIRDHTQRYLESDGANGHLWDSARAGGRGAIPTLLLVTRGRRTGEARTLPLIYGESAGAYVVVASKGGAPNHPSWYLNLVAQPEVAIQVGADRKRANARTATGVERNDLWAKMSDIYPPYNDYQQRTDREIPVIVLESLDD